MEITNALQAIKDLEEEVKNISWSMEYYKTQAKVYDHNAKRADIPTEKRVYKSLKYDYSLNYAIEREKLAKAERKLRAAKLRFKRLFKEGL